MTGVGLLRGGVWVPDFGLDWNAVGSDPRVIIAVGGILLTVVGARIYRLAVLMPGLIGGAAVGLMLGQSLDPVAWIGLSVGLGIVGMALCWFVERAAVSAAGAFVVGGLVHAVGPTVLGGDVAWYWPVAGAVLGLMLFPKLFKAALVFITATLGALAITWSLGASHHLPLLGGIALFGICVQSVGSKRRKKRTED